MDNILAYNVLARLEAVECAIRIQKFSTGTLLRDCNEEVRRLFGEATVGSLGFNVWRCKIGLRGKWCYGRSLVEVVEKVSSP